MIAIDANIVIRFLLNDEPTQAAAARRLIVAGPVRLNATVLLEAHWVLVRLVRLERRRAVQMLRDFCSIGTVQPDEPDRIAKAFDWAEQGMGFADALNLAVVPADGVLISFDRDLAHKAASLGAPEVRAP